MISSCSWWQGTHQEAKTLTSVTLPCRRSASENPGLSGSPSTGGKAKAGTCLPMSADGRSDASPE